MFVCRVSGWLARDYSFKELNTMNLHLSRVETLRKNKWISYLFQTQKAGNAYKRSRSQMGTVFLLFIPLWIVSAA